MRVDRLTNARLLGSSAHTRVTDNADGETGGETRDTNSEASTKINESPAEEMRTWSAKRRIDSLEERVTGGVHAVGNEHRHDETVNGNDTSHDDGNDGLHDELGAHHGHGGDTRSGLGSSVGGAEGYMDESNSPRSTHAGDSADN